MFSLEAFYNILLKNLLIPVKLNYFYFNAPGSTEPDDLRSHTLGTTHLTNFVLFNDQEPLYLNNFNKLHHPNHQTVVLPWNLYLKVYNLNPLKNNHFNVLANSEHSLEKNIIINTLGYYDWYYFCHGLVALDWYRNIRYMPPIRSFSKVFISFNNLFTENRSYRLTLIAGLMDENLHGQGYISLNNDNRTDRIKQEIFSTDSKLSLSAKSLIKKHLLPCSPEFVIDTENFQGELSANDNLDTLCQGLFHLVTETIFYDEKLHLTEKIFKPIVARRPFFLLGAPGNLAYLKTYGFRTFDQWIDESYDNELDPDQRIAKIVLEVKRLCQMPEHELNQIYQEMQDTLEYNFNWFYGGFKKAIVDELVDNFKACLDQHNSTPDYSRNYINVNDIDFDLVKKRLAQ